MSGFLTGKTAEDVTLSLRGLSTLDSMIDWLSQATVPELTDWAGTADVDLSKAKNKADIVSAIIVGLLGDPHGGITTDELASDSQEVSEAASGEDGATLSGENAAEDATSESVVEGEARQKPAYRTGLPDFIVRKNRDELESEIRGWESVPRLPDDHGLSDDELRAYLAVLLRCGERGLKPELWPSWENYPDFK